MPIDDGLNDLEEKMYETKKIVFEDQEDLIFPTEKYVSAFVIMDMIKGCLFKGHGGVRVSSDELEIIWEDYNQHKSFYKDLQEGFNTLENELSVFIDGYYNGKSDSEIFNTVYDVFSKITESSKSSPKRVIEQEHELEHNITRLRKKCNHLNYILGEVKKEDSIEKQVVYGESIQKMAKKLNNGVTHFILHHRKNSKGWDALSTEESSEIIKNLYDTSKGFDAVYYYIRYGEPIRIATKKWMYMLKG